MLLRHYALIIIITFLLEALILFRNWYLMNLFHHYMGSLRMLIVFLCLLPFWKFEIPDKNIGLLFCFSLSMGFLANFFMTLSLNKANIVFYNNWFTISCTICHTLKFFFLKEKVSIKQWILIMVSFFGIFLIGFIL